VIVREMDLQAEAISHEVIESAAKRWARRQMRRGRSGELRWSRSLFVQVAQDWLGFLGRLPQSEEETASYSPVVEDFSRFLDAERGLSAATIDNYSWYVNKFLAWLDALGRDLATASVLDVDAFIAQHHSWSRVTSACCANSLRSFFRHAERRGWCAAGIGAAIERPRIFKQEGLPEARQPMPGNHLWHPTCGGCLRIRVQASHHAIWRTSV
jgi:hypothetical protein